METGMNNPQSHVIYLLNCLNARVVVKNKLFLFMEHRVYLYLRLMKNFQHKISNLPHKINSLFYIKHNTILHENT